MKSIYLIATLDTKAQEIQFIRDALQDLNLPTVLVDVGCLGQAAIEADVAREEVFQAADISLAEMQKQGDRGAAVSNAAVGVANLIQRDYEAGKVAGVLGIGGSAGTSIATSAMRRLPIGVPKVMLSTLASGDVQQFVGTKDITMIHSVVDILGINSITRLILSQAAAAIAGMVQFSNQSNQSDDKTIVDKPIIAATMFGVTTPCIEQAKKVLEAAGFEVLVFHATGAGGRAMESLILEGLIAGVLDITTTELADELVGGVLSAGPNRLTAATKMGIPQVVSVGATDMVNFWAIDTVPEKFKGRNLYKHNDMVTLMRTSVEECVQIGTLLGQKISDAKENATLFLPVAGVSAIDRTAQPFDDPKARSALFDAIRNSCGSVEVVQREEHINDTAFAQAAANCLIELLQR